MFRFSTPSISVLIARKSSHGKYLYECVIFCWSSNKSTNILNVYTRQFMFFVWFSLFVSKSMCFCFVQYIICKWIAWFLCCNSIFIESVARGGAGGGASITRGRTLSVARSITFSSTTEFVYTTKSTRMKIDLAHNKNVCIGISFRLFHWTLAIPLSISFFCLPEFYFELLIYLLFRA